MTSKLHVNGTVVEVVKVGGAACWYELWNNSQKLVPAR